MAKHPEELSTAPALKRFELHCADRGGKFGEVEADSALNALLLAQSKYPPCAADYGGECKMVAWVAWCPQDGEQANHDVWVSSGQE